MSITIVSACLRDMTYIAANMRRSDQREISSVFPAPATVVGATLWASSEGSRWVALLGDDPVCAFGITHLYPGLGSGWAYGTPAMSRTIPAITRFLLRTIIPRELANGLRRVEVRSAIDHDLSHRWLECLGFQREGIARSYGAGGLDFVTYARTASPGFFPHVLLDTQTAAATPRPADAQQG